MNRTASRIALALAAATAMIGGTYAVSAAGDSPAPVNHCKVAIGHADRMAHLQPKMNVAQGVLGVAMTQGDAAKAREQRTELQRLQREYFAVQDDYLAAAALCR